MPESLAHISPQSAPSRTARLAVALATSGDRWLAWTLLGIGLPWLAYTRLYFFLQPRHLTFDGGVFMWYFNKPDPFCGGTRSFAATWRGDLPAALHLYPIGPLLFVATAASVIGLALLLAGGRTLKMSIPVPLQLRVVQVAFAALMLHWVVKLLWLGNN